MKKIFCSICVLVFFVGTTFLFNVSFVFATITGNVDGTEYTYDSNSGSDNILTTKIFDGSYNDVSFDTSSATKLTVKGEDEVATTWDNDTSLTMNTDNIISIISVDKIKLNNNNNLKATSFIISSGSIVNNNSQLTFNDILIDL